MKGAAQNTAALVLLAGARAAGWALLYLAAARLAARLVGSTRTRLSHLAWDGTAGLALLMALLLAVGLWPGGFTTAALAVVLASVVALAALVAARDPVRRFPRGGPVTREGVVVGVLLAAVAVLGLAWDRVPPVFFDSLAYHFAQPESWLVTGRIEPATWSLHSWFPPGMSVLYGVGLAFGGTAAANDANLLVALALVALTFDFGRRLFDPAVGAVSALVLLGLPIVPHAMAIPAADLGHGLFTTAALGGLLLAGGAAAPEERRRAALAAGGALLTKYLGFLAPLALGLGWTLAASRDRSRWRRAAAYAGLALLLLAPWLVANAIVVGNPVAPVAAALWPPSGMAPGALERFALDARGGWPGLDDVRRLGPGLFAGDEQASRFYPTPAWSWLPLVLVPAVLLAAREERRLRRVLALAALLCACWFVTFRWERFLVAASAFLAVALAAGTVWTWRRGGLLRALPLAALGVGALVAVQTAMSILVFTGGAAVALGRVEPRGFVERGFPTSIVYRRANELLDRDRDRVLLVGEMRHFGLDVSRAAPTGFNTHPLAEQLGAGSDPDTAHRELRRQGYTHLIVDRGWIARSARSYPSLRLFAERPDLLERYMHSLDAPLATGGGAVLFAIPER